VARYYYAGGERQPLEPQDDLLAIDTRAASELGLGDSVSRAQVISRLPAGLVIVPRHAVANIEQRLREGEAARSVYRAGNALVVPMPEVRVEFDGPEWREQTLRALSESKVPARITEDMPAALSLRATSGSGEDALDLANYIYERAKPASSTVRLLRVTPKPALGR
jgi:hypothetical protein